MASRGFTKALRAASRQKLPSQQIQRRTLTSFLGARPAIAATPRAAFAGPIQQQVRGVKTIDFAGHKEQVFGELRRLDYVEAALTRPRTRGLATRETSGNILVVVNCCMACSQTLQEYFKNDTLALIGYGSQGHGQGLNLRDNGLNVIIGVRKNGASWKEALQDGWIPGTNLFEMDEAISRGTIVMNLLSDAAQSETWPAIKPQLTKGKVRGKRITT